jgi:hypothetical protein
MKKFMISTAIIVILLIVFLIVNDRIPVKKLYFVFPLNLYVETIYYPKDDYGYILFSKYKNISLCDTIDYIAVSKRMGSKSAMIFIDLAKQNELIFFTTSGMVYKQNSVKYKFLIYKPERTDVYDFYEKWKSQSQRKYLYIEVSEFFQSVFILNRSNRNDSCIYKLNPIN